MWFGVVRVMAAREGGLAAVLVRRVFGIVVCLERLWGGGSAIDGPRGCGFMR